MIKDLSYNESEMIKTEQVMEAVGGILKCPKTPIGTSAKKVRFMMPRSSVVSSASSSIIGESLKSMQEVMELSDSYVKNFGLLLTKKEQEVFGDRCPKGFTKIDRLSKCGKSIVWLGERKS